MDVERYLAAKGVDFDEARIAHYYQMETRFSILEDAENSIDRIILYIQERYGRFGNNIYQLAHAIIIARYLGFKTVDCCFQLAETLIKRIFVEDVIVNFGLERAPTAPSISATLFLPNGFRSCFQNVDLLSIKSDCEKIGRAIFPAKAVASGSGDKKIVVFHFRSGDVFVPGKFFNPLYVQPPLAYYILALDHICSTMEDFDIRVVYENLNNPCIAKFVDLLSARGLPHHIQSASFLEDAHIINTADTIVSSFGTFCEGLALTSEHIRRWYAFRTCAAHEEEMRPFLPYRFRDVLLHDAVSLFLVEDRAGAYIAKGKWDLSAEQLGQLVDYPIQNLRVSEILS